MGVQPAGVVVMDGSSNGNRRSRGHGMGGSALHRLLERRIGPWSGRVWGLIFNLVANGLMLWGISSLLRTGSGWAWIVIGGLGTVICMAALALPARSEEPRE